MMMMMLANMKRRDKIVRTHKTTSVMNPTQGEIARTHKNQVLDNATLIRQTLRLRRVMAEDYNCENMQEMNDFMGEKTHFS
jgi:hypothetical protein